MSALRTRCHRSVGTELSLVDVGDVEDLLDQISKLQHQVSSLQQELKRLSDERRLSGAGLDAQKQQTLHDCVGAPRACGVGETEQPSASTPGCVCGGDELQEGVSEGEEAEPLQDGDEHTLNTLSKVCSIKLMGCRMAPTLNAHITREEAEDTGQDEFDMSYLDKWLKQSISHGKRSSTCSECGKTFSRPSTLRAHMRKHTGETLPHCPCGKSFSYTSSLSRHQKECCSLFCDSQNERKVPPEEPKQYQCSFCGKQFSSKGHVTIHERLHTGKKPYECSECKQAFVRVDRLKEHQRVHTGEKPYECSYCGKPFSLLGGLKKHHRTHTGEKPYKCNICKKRFIQSTKLKIHLRTHTGERPYRCSECGKAFTRTEHLRTHQKIHSAGKRQGGALRGGRVVSVAYSTKPQTTE